MYQNYVRRMSIDLMKENGFPRSLRYRAETITDADNLKYLANIDVQAGYLPHSLKQAIRGIGLSYNIFFTREVFEILRKSQLKRESLKCQSTTSWKLKSEISYKQKISALYAPFNQE